MQPVISGPGNGIPEHIRVCNCCACGRELISPRDRKWYGQQTKFKKMSIPPLMVDRIGGRPYCGLCLPGGIQGETT